MPAEAASIDSSMTAETKTNVPSSPLLPPSNPIVGAHHTAPSPPIDLRHVTSSSALSPASARSPPTSAGGNRSNRVSQHYPLGSMSPGSIPSSPTSVHSSSSAIFERDIEPLPTSPSNLLSPQSHPVHTHHSSSHPPNPHHIARGHTTESLEQSVPSVLDSAAEILAHMQNGPGGGDNLIVESPVAPRGRGGSRDGRSSGWASPRSVGSYRSRSPSPFGSSAGQGSLLLSIPSMPGQGSPPVTSSILNATAASPLSTSPSPPRPTIATAATLNSPTLPLDTPTSAYFSTTSSVDGDVDADDEDRHLFSGKTHHEDPEPRTTTREQAPEYPWGANPGRAATTSSSSSPSPTSPSFTFNMRNPHRETSTPSMISSSTIPSSSTANTNTSSHSNPNAAKRLSFLSYTDLLTSTPTSTLPLSSFTTAASMGAEPPHITGVGMVVDPQPQVQSPNNGLPLPPHHSSSGAAAMLAHSYSSGGSVGSHSPPSPFSTFSFTGPAPTGAVSPAPAMVMGDASRTTAPGSVAATSKRNSLAGGNSNRGSVVFLDDLVGGEWEREGLGRGLDERLEGVRIVT